jgi:hypothetical protein
MKRSRPGEQRAKEQSYDCIRDATADAQCTAALPVLEENGGCRRSTFDIKQGLLDPPCAIGAQEGGSAFRRAYGESARTLHCTDCRLLDPRHSSPKSNH